MAKTAFETDNPLKKQAWEETLFRDVEKESYFSKFMGETKDSIVYVQADLEKDQGDEVNFGLRNRLTGAGVEDDEILEGNEEALSTYNYALTLKHYRHAVRDKGRLHRKRPFFSIDTESVAALKTWGAEKIDSLCFAALESTYTKVGYIASGGSFALTTSFATAKAALHATDSKLNLNFVSFLKTWAKTGGNRDHIPLRPIMVDGLGHYILLVHPECLYDLKTTSAYQQAQREAQERGKDNPIFSGASAYFDGVIIHEHENCSTFTDGGGASVNGANAALLGAQSLCWAWGVRPEVHNETFDYGNQHGFSWEMIARAGKPTFNSKVFGSLGVCLARTSIA